MQENLKKKYNITTEQFNTAVDQIRFGNIACDTMALLALIDLVSYGDVELPRTETTAREKELEEELEIARQALYLVCYDIKTEDLTPEAKESNATKKAIEDLENDYIKEAKNVKSWLKK